MAQPAVRLVGRAVELESIDHALAELARARAGDVELAGEPGIGKTRLLAELAARADARGRLVLAGNASELEREPPFWVFVDALDEYVQGLAPNGLDSMDADARAELGHVLPSLPAATQIPPERYRTHRAVRRLLEALARSKPLVLIVDDVHWADPASVELLEALARSKPLVLVVDDVHWADPASVELLGSLLRRPPSGVLIALALRPRQVPERLQGPLQRAHSAGTLTRLELGPLTVDDARELLGGDFSAAAYDECRGNPFHLQQLARFPDARTLAAALAEELALLPDDTRRLLEGAAVAGDPFEPELAAAAAGVAAAAATADLAEAAVALDRDDAAAAAELALSAAARAEQAGAALDGAVARALAGRALAQAGDPERALAELDRAAAQLEACRAPRRRDAAERELGRLGRRRHRRTRRGAGAYGVESLTERELEVARLIVDRRTNAQIAAELFLSPKTVESHVRNLFHKLDVSSRADVARIVERARIAHSG